MGVGIGVGGLGLGFGLGFGLGLGLGVGVGGEPSLSLSLARHTSPCSRREAATREPNPNAQPKPSQAHLPVLEKRGGDAA